MYGSIHLTSYCSASAIIGLNTAGQVIKNFGKKQKRTPLVNHEVEYLVCVLPDTNWPCKQPVQDGLIVVFAMPGAHIASQS